MTSEPKAAHSATKVTYITNTIIIQFLLIGIDLDIFQDIFKFQDISRTLQDIWCCASFTEREKIARY